MGNNDFIFVEENRINGKFSYVATPEEEKKMILKKYRNLVHLLEPVLTTPERKKKLKKAFQLAAAAHNNTRRKSGEPYILHPIAVARIVIEEIGMGLECAISALLHDVIEDTDISLDIITKKFGDKVAGQVMGLTKMKALSDPKISTQIENIKKILIHIVRDPKVILIKLADRLHNMRTLREMNPEKRIEISSETMQIYVPIAHRLGLFNIKTELEDLAMSYLESGSYNEIVTQLDNTKRERNYLINSFIGRIKKLLETENIDVPYKISGRTKSIFSIWSKMKHKNIPLKEVYDLFAIRIILDVPMDIEKEKCWQVFLLISKHFYILQDRVRDWIRHPKSNGYMALHTTVLDKNGKWIEIQIRSERMDRIAEKGLAAHFRYKENKDTVSLYDEWIMKIRHLVENKDEGDTENILEDFQNSLVVDEILVFTPTGEMKQLPKEASVLDFAYTIHTRIGERCIGAKVNNKAVSMETKLHAGDKVTILTSEKQKPSEQHLEFLVSPRARKAVNKYIKKENKIIAIKGMKIFSNHLKALGIVRKKNYKKIILRKFRYPNMEDFFVDVAKENVDMNLITPEFFNGVYAPLTKLSEDDNITDPAEDYKYSVAVCCKPIAGDQVCGIINKNTDPATVHIHTVGCKEAEKTMAHYDCKVLNLKWRKKENILFAMNVLVQGLDRQGLIYEITKLISHDLQINIGSFVVDMETHVRSKLVEFRIKLFVENKNQWFTLIKELQNIDGITYVERIL